MLCERDGSQRGGQGSGCGGRMDRVPMTAGWELGQYASTETAAELSAATLAPDEWTSTMQNCGPSDMHSGGQ